jgi:hypothetical protein
VLPDLYSRAQAQPTRSRVTTGGRRPDRNYDLYRHGVVTQTFCACKGRKNTWQCSIRNETSGEPGTRKFARYPSAWNSFSASVANFAYVCNVLSSWIHGVTGSLNRSTLWHIFQVSFFCRKSVDVRHRFLISLLIHPATTRVLSTSSQQRKVPSGWYVGWDPRTAHLWSRFVLTSSSAWMTETYLLVFFVCTFLVHKKKCSLLLLCTFTQKYMDKNWTSPLLLSTSAVPLADGWFSLPSVRRRMISIKKAVAIFRRYKIRYNLTSQTEYDETAIAVSLKQKTRFTIGLQHASFVAEVPPYGLRLSFFLRSLSLWSRKPGLQYALFV